MKPPALHVLACDAERRADGVVLLTVGRNTRSIHKTSPFEAVVAIDRRGRIVWHREFAFCLMDCRRSLRDTLLVMGTDGRAAEIALDGRLLHQWYCAPRFPDGLDGTPLATEKLHHTICEIAPDRLLSLSIEHRALAEPRGGWTHLMADTVVVFDRAGRIDREIPLAGLLDLDRFGHDADAPYWARQGWPGTLDWSHANCAIADPQDGGVLVSLRHQDAVVKIDFCGALAWILGDPGGWTGEAGGKLLAIEGGRPFYHQHDLSFTAAGELLLFDNGSAGAVPPKPSQALEAQESFALAYAIDAGRKTAREVWRYGGADLPFSQYVGGVCEMPGGNRFIACTGVSRAPDGSRVAVPPQGTGSIVLEEVDMAGATVFHAVLADAEAAPDAGWAGFRPEYLPARLAARLASA